MCPYGSEPGAVVLGLMRKAFVESVAPTGTPNVTWLPGFSPSPPKTPLAAWGTVRMTPAPPIGSPATRSSGDRPVPRSVAESGEGEGIATVIAGVETHGRRTIGAVAGPRLKERRHRESQGIVPIGTGGSGVDMVSARVKELQSPKAAKQAPGNPRARAQCPCRVPFTTKGYPSRLVIGRGPLNTRKARKEGVRPCFGDRAGKAKRGWPKPAPCRLQSEGPGSSPRVQ
jgi:hypothetical protein